MILVIKAQIKRYFSSLLQCKRLNKPSLIIFIQVYFRRACLFTQKESDKKYKECPNLMFMGNFGSNLLPLFQTLLFPLINDCHSYNFLQCIILNLY